MNKMGFFTRFRWFQKAAMAIFFTYCAIMVIVLIIGILRPSGSAGIDMTQIVQLRNQQPSE